MHPLNQDSDRARCRANNALPIALLSLLALAAACGGPRVDHLEATNAVGPYSAAVGVGDVVWLSGKIGKPGGAFGEEVSSALDNVATDLTRLGLSLADVVSVNVFLTDMALFDELNGIYAARFPKPWPARTTVAVAALPKGARVEIQVVAHRH